MPTVNIVDTGDRRPQLDVLTLGATDTAPTVSVVVTVCRARVYWYMYLRAGDGRILIPPKVISATENAFAAHAATLKAQIGRALVCSIVTPNGTPSADVPLFGQATIMLS